MCVCRKSFERLPGDFERKSKRKNRRDQFPYEIISLPLPKIVFVRDRQFSTRGRLPAAISIISNGNVALFRSF